jgi:hypothetical protein
VRPAAVAPVAGGLALLAATAAAVVGFWGAGSVESDNGAVGILSLPLYWAAGRLIGWWVLPSPILALVAGIALGNANESNNNELAWFNYAGGLLLCETVAIWGLIQRLRADRLADRLRSIGKHPERPR